MINTRVLACKLSRRKAYFLTQILGDGDNSFVFEYFHCGNDKSDEDGDSQEYEWSCHVVQVQGDRRRRACQDILRDVLWLTRAWFRPPRVSDRGESS